MFGALLAITPFCQPGLPHGIIPGMTEDQVASVLGEGGCITIGLGEFGRCTSTYYRQSKLWIHYELGQVRSVQRGR